MALVAYDHSDSSDYESEEDVNAPVVELIKKPEVRIVSETPKEAIDAPENGTLFNLLPQPSTQKPAVVEEDDEFLHKKEEPASDVVKPKAKIMVPSLSDFKDVDSITPVAKPRIANGKKSGLLSMLPQPKNAPRSTTTSNSLIPNVLQKQNTVKKKSLPSPAKKPKVDETVTKDSDDSDNDDEVQNDFFSIHKPVEIPVDVPIETEAEPPPIKQNTTRKIESYFKKDVLQSHVDLQPDTEQYDGYSEAGTSYNDNITGAIDAGSSYNGEVAGVSETNGDAVLDEEAILKLCGTRGKRRREEIQIVDVNQQEVLANARELLLKGIMDDTSKRVSSSKRRGNEPTSQQKRKHQITYLAHQAKANEAELESQWASNRMNKRKAQSKYGF